MINFETTSEKTFILLCTLRFHGNRVVSELTLFIRVSTAQHQSQYSFRQKMLHDIMTGETLEYDKHGFFSRKTCFSAEDQGISAAIGLGILKYYC